MGKKVTEATEAPKVLLRDFRPVSLSVVEGSDGGRVRVRGEFARADLPTENRRVYQRSLWEREIGRLTKNVGDRKVLGELDHPADGRTQLSRVSHILTGLELDPDSGVVVGEAEILDTDRGKNLAALLKSGARIGVSSRGYGSTKSNEKGEDIVQDDYRLLTFDFVADPADSTAYPEVFFEGKEVVEMPGTLKEVTLESLQSERPDLVEAVSAKVKEESKDAFAKQLVEAVEKAKEEMKESVRGELLSDPSVAGAKTALDKMKEFLRPYVVPEDVEALVKEKDGEIGRLHKQIEDRDARIKELENEVQEASGVAQIAGYKFFVEKELSGDENADAIRDAIGDVKEFDSIDSLKSRLESVRKDINREKELREAVARGREEEAKRKDAEIERLNTKIEEMGKVVESATATAKTTSLQLYIERKVASHPNSVQLRALFESAKPSSKEEIDNLIEKFKAPARSPEVVETTRARVRSLTGGGASAETPSREEAPLHEGKEDENFMGLGASLTELRHLSGMGQ